MTDNAAELAEVKKQFNTWESEKFKIGEELESVNNLLQKAKSEINVCFIFIIFLYFFTVLGAK